MTTATDHRTVEVAGWLGFAVGAILAATTTATAFHVTDRPAPAPTPVACQYVGDHPTAAFLTDGIRCGDHVTYYID